MFTKFNKMKIYLDHTFKSSYIRENKKLLPRAADSELFNLLFSIFNLNQTILPAPNPTQVPNRHPMRVINTFVIAAIIFAS